MERELQEAGLGARIRRRRRLGRQLFDDEIFRQQLEPPADPAAVRIAELGDADLILADEWAVACVAAGVAVAGAHCQAHCCRLVKTHGWTGRCSPPVPATTLTKRCTPPHIERRCPPGAACSSPKERSACCCHSSLRTAGLKPRAYGIAGGRNSYLRVPYSSTVAVFVLVDNLIQRLRTGTLSS